MAQSFPNVNLSTAWLDLVGVAGMSSVAGRKVTVQNRSNDSVLVFFGGASAPAGADGACLLPGVDVTGTNTHVWVRALTSSAAPLAAWLED